MRVINTGKMNSCFRNTHTDFGVRVQRNHALSLLNFKTIQQAPYQWKALAGPFPLGCMFVGLPGKQVKTRHRAALPYTKIGICITKTGIIFISDVKPWRLSESCEVIRR